MAHRRLCRRGQAPGGDRCGRSRPTGRAYAVAVEGPRNAPAPPGPVIAFVLPGIGHYLPISSLIQELGPPGGAIIAAQVDADHPLCTRIADDGFAFVPVPSLASATRSARPLRAAARLLRSRVAPRLAAHGRNPIGLPALPARLAFAMGTQVLPIPHTTPAAGAAVAAILDDARPSLVLAEYDSPWFELLAAERSVPFVRYTTGPVGGLWPGRPVSPAGLDPALPGAERLANALNRRARLLRARRSDRVWRAARAEHLRGRAAPSGPGPLAQVSFSAASLDDYPRCPQDAFEYVGASLYRPDGPVGPEGERDSIFVTWGSWPAPSDDEVMLRLLPALVGASSANRVVVQTGDQALRDRIAAAGPEITVVGPAPAPRYDEYRRARLVIGHGGYGTIIESLCFGVPVLTLPLMAADRLETGQRLLQSGAGLVLDRSTFGPQDASRAIERLLAEPGFAARARTIGAELRDRSARDRLLDRLRPAVEASPAP